MNRTEPSRTYRKKDVRASHDGEREDDGPGGAVDAPPDGHERRAGDDHAGEEDPGEEGREPEALEDLGDLLEEVGPLDLLLRRAPGHVVREAVGEDGLGDGDREPAEEEEAVFVLKSVIHATGAGN